jgi:regulator of protease activity HflC (stomatin/prohibitin superfamily)
MDFFAPVLIGCLVYFILRCVLGGFYIVNQNERAVKTIFGKAQRIKGKTTLDDPISEKLREDEQERYTYPQVKVILPGGPYFKWPWEKIYKVSIAIETTNMAYDPEFPNANQKNTVLEAVTKDQLNIGLSGQIRYRVSDKNLYAYIFGVKNPIAHVMGYFVSVLRERIANFEGKSTDPDAQLLMPTAVPDTAADAAGNPAGGAVSSEAGTYSTYSALQSSASSAAQGISINDLRKNLRELNDHMDEECSVSAARYGVVLEASLITQIDPPAEVESALAAINTAHNQVSSDISLAQASADQKIVQSKRAVEIETLKAQGEIETLQRLSSQLKELKEQGGAEALHVYVRNAKLALFDQTKRIVRREKR